jgi:putative DNA primase/helicase
VIATSLDELKRSFDKARLAALAEREGLATAPGRIQCPHRCSDEKRGASVSDDGLWHCKRCDRGGSAFDLVMATRSLSFDDAVAALRDSTGELPARAPPRPAPDAGDLWRKLSAEDAAGLDYLRTRGLEGAVAQGAVRFNVGRSGHGWLDHKSAEGYRVAMPLYSVQGALTSFQLRSITPGANPAKLSLSGITYPAGGVAFGIPGRARSEQRVFVAEGMADTLALLIAGAVAIGAPGVDQVKKLPGFLGDVQGRVIILCPQNDAPRVAAGKKVALTSEQAFRELEAHLSAAGAEVVMLHTPPPHKDPAEWMRAVGVERFKAALDDAQPELELQVSVVAGNTAMRVVRLHPEGDPRPKIIIRVEEHEVVEQAVAALTKDYRVFQRDGSLVHVVRDEAPRGTPKDGLTRPAAAPRIAPMHSAVLRERMAAAARWMKPRKSKGDMVPDHPPDWAVRAIHARGSWTGVRWLTGVVEAPVLRPDGTILDQPGYDLATGLLYEPSGPFVSIPPNPTRDDARAAAGVLLNAVIDFPFERDEHRLAWLAALLTPLARHAFEGPAPLFLMDANTRASGKSKLTDLISVVVSGRDMPRMAPEQREEEWRKRITSIAMCGDPLVLVDNVTEPLGSAALDGALTGTAIFDRAMGGNTTITARLISVWYASGNNVQLKGDLFRRTLHVRLESPLQKPEEREDFEHPDLLAWARVERPRLLGAALTILRAHYLAGRPTVGMKNWGSFEAWSRVVRGAITWLGMADPYVTRERLQEAADVDAQQLAQLLSAWEEHCGSQAFTLRQITKEFEKEEQLSRTMKQVPTQPRLYDVFSEMAPPQGGTFNILKLQKQLNKFRGRVCDGRRLEGQKNRLSITEWRITGGAGVAGVAGVPGVDIGEKSPPLQTPLFSRVSMQGTPATPATPADEAQLGSAKEAP